MYFTSKTYADVVAGRHIQTRYQPCSEKDMDKVAPYHGKSICSHGGDKNKSK